MTRRLGGVNVARDARVERGARPQRNTAVAGTLPSPERRAHNADVRLALVLGLALATACARPAAGPPPPHLVRAVPSDELAAGEDEVSMEIVELMCRPCASRIVGGAELLPGVTGVRMELATKTLTLRFDAAQTQRDRVIASVERIVAGIQ